MGAIVAENASDGALFTISCVLLEKPHAVVEVYVRFDQVYGRQRHRAALLADANAKGEGIAQGKPSDG